MSITTKPRGRRRTVNLMVKLLPHEKQWIEARAREAMMPMSVLVRRAVPAWLWHVGADAVSTTPAAKKRAAVRAARLAKKAPTGQSQTSR